MTCEQDTRWLGVDTPPQKSRVFLHGSDSQIEEEPVTIHASRAIRQQNVPLKVQVHLLVAVHKEKGKKIVLTFECPFAYG